MTVNRRDREIITLMAEGLSSKQMVDELKHTVASIETYRHKLIIRHGARNAAHLVAMAFRNKIVM